MASSTIESIIGGFEYRDYISDLPQSITENILMLLPIRDAAKTSVLSTKWRYRWAAMRHLVFDILPYTHLRVIELYEVHFEDIKEILMVLRLITNSPNLTEIVLSGSSNTLAAVAGLDFWEKERPNDCTLKQLRTIKMTDMSDVPHEIEFIKFLLANSPVLKKLIIVPSVYAMDGGMNLLIQLAELPRASPQAELVFIPE